MKKSISLNTKNLFAHSLGVAFLIFQPIAKVFANPVTVTVNGTSYELNSNNFTNYSEDLPIFQGTPWWGDSSAAYSFAEASNINLQLNENSRHGSFFIYKTDPDGRIYYHIYNGISNSIYSNTVSGYNCYTQGCGDNGFASSNSTSTSLN